jgi:hypothetical protein
MARLHTALILTLNSLSNDKPSKESIIGSASKDTRSIASKARYYIFDVS